MFPKSRLNTVSVNYCPVSQDFAGSSLSLLTSRSGKKQLPASLSVRLLVKFGEPPSGQDLSPLICSPVFGHWRRSGTHPRSE